MPVSKHLVATSRSDLVSILKRGASLTSNGQSWLAFVATENGTSIHSIKEFRILSSFLKRESLKSVSYSGKAIINNKGYENYSIFSLSVFASIFLASLRFQMKVSV